MAASLNLKTIFGMPPEQAIRYLQSKGSQITFDWYEMLGNAHTRAFTVAKATSQDVLDALRGEVEKAIRQGMTVEQFQRNLQPRLVEMGWWGKAPVLDGMTGEITTATLGTSSRLRTIFQTNMSTAYAAGRFEAFEDNKQNRPYLMYIAVEDGRTRPEHLELHGRVWHIDDPIWDVIYPPNGFGCRCRVVALSLNDVERMGLKVETSSGFQLVDIVLNKEGDTAQVKTVQIMGRDGKPKWFRPDAGWDYHVGKTA